MNLRYLLGITDDAIYIEDENGCLILGINASINRKDNLEQLLSKDILDASITKLSSRDSSKSCRALTICLEA